MPKPTTPLVGSDSFITNENNEVLLVQRAETKTWSLPGGFTNLGETPAEGAVRETKEETGYSTTITKLLGVFHYLKYKHQFSPYNDEIVHILFAATITGGTPTPSDETITIQWFPKDNLPTLYDGHKERIEVGFTNLQNPNTPPHFE